MSVHKLYFGSFIISVKWKIYIILVLWTWILNILFSFLLSIPVENFEDHSAPPSPDEKDSGFFMLRKDSERRATLHHILTEDRDKVVANLTEALTQVCHGKLHQSFKKKKRLKTSRSLYASHPLPSPVPIWPSPSLLQGSEEMKLKPQHISTLVVSLAEFVRMADRKIIANTLSQLKLELDFDSTAISQLQVVLFGFQDAVSVQQRNTSRHDRTRLTTALSIEKEFIAATFLSLYLLLKFSSQAAHILFPCTCNMCSCYSSILCLLAEVLVASSQATGSELFSIIVVIFHKAADSFSRLPCCCSSCTEIKQISVKYL